MNIILQDALAYVVYSLSQPSFPDFKHTGLTTGLTVRHRSQPAVQLKHATKKSQLQISCMSSFRDTYEVLYLIFFLLLPVPNTSPTSKTSRERAVFSRASCSSTVRNLHTDRDQKSHVNKKFGNSKNSCWC